MARVALYPGSFDPLTNGHVDVIKAAAMLCDHLVIGVGVHASKAPMLSADERLKLIEETAKPIAAAAGIAVEVRSFDNLVVDFARTIGATVLVRGVRDVSDLDYELQMAGMNAQMAPSVQTVFVPPSPETRHITATLVRQISALGGEIAPFVPPAVARHLAGRRA